MLEGFLPRPAAGSGRGYVFSAFAAITSLAAYTATSALGGPVLFNGSSNKGV